MVVGDEQVGKTSFLQSFVNQPYGKPFYVSLTIMFSVFQPTLHTYDPVTFPPFLFHTPFLFSHGSLSMISNPHPPASPSKLNPEGHKTDLKLDGNLFHLTLYEASYDRFQSKLPACADANIFLVCFSVVSPQSCESLKEKWVPELIKRHSAEMPILLVGTKTDLRLNAKMVSELVESGHQPIYERTGMQLARKVGAVNYVECCALDGEEVKRVMDEAVRSARDVEKEKSLAPKGRCVVM